MITSRGLERVFSIRLGFRPGYGVRLVARGPRRRLHSASAQEAPPSAQQCGPTDARAFEARGRGLKPPGAGTAGTKSPAVDGNGHLGAGGVITGSGISEAEVATLQVQEIP